MTVPLDEFIDVNPFFTPEHRNLALRIRSFVEREIENRPAEQQSSDESVREFVRLLAQAGLLRYAVSLPNAPLDTRAICIIRESLAYSSALADIAFVMQGLGT